MRRTVRIPAVHKRPSFDAEAITTVRIPNLQDWAGHGLPLRHQQFQAAVSGLQNGKQRYRPLFNGHLHGQTTPNFSVMHLKWPHLGLALCDLDMAGPVTPHKDYIIIPNPSHNIP